jgi:hypothetical protein
MKVLANAFLIGLLFAVSGTAQNAPAISGDYVEARSGEVYTCGCLFSSEMVTAGRDAILVWRINSGSFQGTPLAGIKIAAVVESMTNLGIEEAPRRSVLYIDVPAGPEKETQEKVLPALWQREYSKVLGHVQSLHSATINFELQGEAVTVAIPGLVKLQARKAQLPNDAHPGSFLWYSPFTPLDSSFLSTSFRYEYLGADFQHQWTDLMPGIRGYLGRFAFSSGV